MPSLEGKSAVVTGASSGIGAATALALTREGARVVGGARRSDRIQPPVTPLEVDVTDPASCERFVNAAAEELNGTARRLEQPADTAYGHRRYGAEDPEGHQWYFAQEIRRPKSKRKTR